MEPTMSTWVISIIKHNNPEKTELSWEGGVGFKIVGGIGKHEQIRGPQNPAGITSLNTTSTMLKAPSTTAQAVLKASASVSRKVLLAIVDDKLIILFLDRRGAAVSLKT
jgi:hypothetical protein